MEIDPDNYYLSWGGFQRNIKSTFADLALEKHFTDVTLVCEGEKQISAHKVVLSASSPFFKQILIKNPHQHPLIYLKGVRIAELSSVIEFIYYGEVKVKECDLQSFLKVCEELEVKGLSELFIHPEIIIHPENPKRELEEDDGETNFGSIDLDTDFESDLDKAVFIDDDDKEELSESEFRKNLEEVVSTIQEKNKEAKFSISSSGSSDLLLEHPTHSSEEAKTIDQSDTKPPKRRSISLSLFGRGKSKDRKSKRDHSRVKLNFSQIDDKAEEIEWRYKCDECERIFKYEVLLVEHKTSVHEFAFQCINCDTKCRTKEHLNRHMELKDHY